MNDVEASRALVLSCMHVVFREAGGQVGRWAGGQKDGRLGFPVAPFHPSDLGTRGQ